MGIPQSSKKLPFLSCSVPNLSLDHFPINIQAPCSELDPNSGLGLEAELVSGEPREEIRLAYARVADEDDLEEVVIVVLCSVSCHFFFLSERENSSEERRGWVTHLGYLDFFSFLGLKVFLIWEFGWVWGWWILRRSGGSETGGAAFEAHVCMSFPNHFDGPHIKKR